MNSTPGSPLRLSHSAYRLFLLELGDFNKLQNSERFDKLLVILNPIVSAISSDLSDFSDNTNLVSEQLSQIYLLPSIPAILHQLLKLLVNLQHRSLSYQIDMPPAPYLLGF